MVFTESAFILDPPRREFNPHSVVVIVAAGFAPPVELAKEAGLAISRGIVVNGAPRAAANFR
jgi:NAD(P)H-nitrite reductase large subunit